MRTVFISYATADAQFAHRLADDLRRLDVQVWIAPESIRGGEDWVAAINRGLKESSHMVVVLTPAAVKSRWVEIETNTAIALEREGRIQIIPLGVKPCEVPPLLSSYQRVPFRDYDAGLSQLTDILGVRVTPPEPVRHPEMPKNYGIKILSPSGEEPTVAIGNWFILTGTFEEEPPSDKVKLFKLPQGGNYWRLTDIAIDLNYRGSTGEKWRARIPVRDGTPGNKVEYIIAILGKKGLAEWNRCEKLQTNQRHEIQSLSDDTIVCDSVTVTLA